MEQGDAIKEIRCVGPLNLNRQTKKANTVFKTELILDGKEFDALDMMAAREGEPLAFEQLYAAVWHAEDGQDGREAARSGLDNITRQVKEAGDGFMWISRTPEAGYIFQTRWGHNRRTW